MHLFGLIFLHVLGFNVEQDPFKKFIIFADLNE